MKTSPPETNDQTRNGLSLVAFSFLTAATWVAVVVVIFGIAYLSNPGH
jgi:hypothetical protein